MDDACGFCGQPASHDYTELHHAGVRLNSPLYLCARCFDEHKRYLASNDTNRMHPARICRLCDRPMYRDTVRDAHTRCLDREHQRRRAKGIEFKQWTVAR